MTIKSPSGREYSWNKDQPPSKEDWDSLIAYDKTLGEQKPQPKSDQKESTIGQVAGDIATEAGVSTAGQLIGAATGPGYFVIAPASGVYGNYLKQQREIERGVRKDVSVGELVASGLINLLPAANVAKATSIVTKPFVAEGVKLAERTLAERALASAAVRSVEGALIAPAAKTVETVYEEAAGQRKDMWPTWDEYKGTILGGAAIGGAVGAAEPAVTALSKKGMAFWKSLSGKSVSEASQEIERARLTGSQEERDAANEVIDEVGQRMGIVRSGPTKSAQEAAAVMGVQPVKSARESASLLSEVPLTQSEIDSRYVGALEPKSAEESAAAMGIQPVKSAKESAALLAQGAEENAIRARDFEKAKIELAAQEMQAGRLAEPESTTFVSSPENVQLNILDTRPGASARERARLERGLGVTEQEKLPTTQDVLSEFAGMRGIGSTQRARQLGLEGGFISPDVAIPVARAGAGAAIGYAQGDTPEERAKYALLGAGAGLIASPSLIKSAVKKISPKANTVEEALAEKAGVKPVQKIKASTTPSEASPIVQKTLEDMNIKTEKPKLGLADVHKMFLEPEAKGRKQGVWEKLVQSTQNLFYPIDVVEKNIKGYKPKFTLGDRFSLIAGAGAKAEPAIADMQRVYTEIAGDIHPLDINSYFFLKRTENRLNLGVSTGKWTIDDVNRVLPALLEKLGPEKSARLEQFGQYMQREADKDLLLMVESGRMSKEMYAQIKARNDFYAPFFVTNKLGEIDGNIGRGGSVTSSIDTQAELSKAMKGFDSEDIRIGDIFTAFKRNKYIANVLAEKNKAMLDLADLGIADKDGKFIRFINKPSLAPEGFEAVSYLKDGQQKYMAVDKGVAKAISGMSPMELGVMNKWLQLGALGLRAGATSMNAAWLVANTPIDLLRQATMSKYGIKSPKDLIPWSGYANDFAQALGSAIAANAPGRFKTHTDLYKAYLESGAARSNFQSVISQDSFTKSVLRGDDSTVAKLVGVADKYILGTPSAISNMLEETTKLMGLKRGMRFENIDSLTKAERDQAMQRIAYEVRNYSGSPDFSKFGTLGRQANLLFMFANARAQGIAADVSRLVGQTGKREAAESWAKLGAIFGVPAALLWSINNSPENKADYDQLSQRDKDNFFNLPLFDADGKPKYSVDKYGRKVRDYARFPKRDIPSLMSNTIEKALDYYQTQDPEAVSKWAESMAEGVSPVSISGRTPTERLSSVLSSVNPAAKVAFEQATNYDLFRKRAIVPPALQDVSPRLQFNETTPEVYKQVANAVPGVSPLRMQQAVEGLTGGALSQFVKKDRVGVSEEANNPLTSRFFRTSGIDETNDFNLADKLSNQAADRRVERELVIGDVVNKAMALPIEQRSAFIRQALPNELLSDPDLGNSLVKAVVDNQLKITPLERKVRSLQPSERAQFIFEQIKKLKTDDQKKAYINRMASIPEMLSKGVADALSDYQKLDKRSSTLK